MAGYREFQTGEVLTAANVNDFLMDQSVMKFADAAARDSALGTAVGGANALREGMVAYLDDTDDLLKFDGTAWATVGGGLVAVKSAIKTDTFASSLAPGASAAVTGLSITHAMADADNTLLLWAFFGAAASTGGQRGQVGIAINDGTNFLSVGDASGSRTRITAGGMVAGDSSSNLTVTMPSIAITHAPASTSSLTYSVHAFQLDSVGTRTVYVNRSIGDSNDSAGARTASSLILMEVKV